MIQNYIFDLYGTLVDIHTDEAMPSLWRRMALFLSLQGAAYTPEELKTAYHLAIREQLEKRSRQLPSLAQEYVEPEIRLVFEALYTQKGVNANDHLIRDSALTFRTLSMLHLRVYPHAKTVLLTLRKRRKGVYLLSNAQAVFTIPELKKLGIFSFFDGIVLSSDVGIKKPDKAIFQYMLETYGLYPDSCVMIGNDEIADMHGAASVGMAGRYIHTKQSPDHRDTLPPRCREIQSLSELLSD